MFPQFSFDSLFSCCSFTHSLSYLLFYTLFSVCHFFSPSPSHFHNRCHILQQIINSSKFQSLFSWPFSLPPPFLPILLFSFPSLFSPHLPSISFSLMYVSPQKKKEREWRESQENKEQSKQKEKDRMIKEKGKSDEREREDALPFFKTCQITLLSSSL